MKLRTAQKSRVVTIGDRQIVSLGLDRNLFTDFYHRCMKASWRAFFLGALAVFLTINTLFALLFALGDAPVANAPSGLNMQLFYFSTETLATVGYGDMHPQTHYGHLIAGAEIFLGMTFTAVMTGLIYARFARPVAMIVFARNPVVGRHDGRQTLMLRFANARHNVISNASAKLWLSRTEQTAEGAPFRRIHDLKLARTENPALVLSWTIFHTIEDGSPLHGVAPEDFAASSATLILSVGGRDENFGQDVHARKNFNAADLRWAHRYRDILSVREDGVTVMDHSLLHDVVEDRAVEVMAVEDMAVEVMAAPGEAPQTAAS